MSVATFRRFGRFFPLSAFSAKKSAERSANPVLLHSKVEVVFARPRLWFLPLCRPVYNLPLIKLRKTKSGETVNKSSLLPTTQGDARPSAGSCLAISWLFFFAPRRRGGRETRRRDAAEGESKEHCKAAKERQPRRKGGGGGRDGMDGFPGGSVSLSWRVSSPLIASSLWL